MAPTKRNPTKTDLMIQKTKLRRVSLPPINTVEYDVHLVGTILCCLVPHLNFNLTSSLLIHTYVINHIIMQRDALAATVNLCCKQNLSARLQKERARLKKHELQDLDTYYYTVPCVVRGYLVSLCESIMLTDTDNVIIIIMYLSYEYSPLIIFVYL